MSEMDPAVHPLFLVGVVIATAGVAFSVPAAYLDPALVLIAALGTLFGLSLVVLGEYEP